MILVDEGLVWTLHAGSRKRSGGNFFAKSCRSRLQQSGPGAEVWQVRSMTARWIQEHDPRCVVAVFQSLASGKFSQRAKRAHPGASEGKKTLRSSVQGPVRPQIPVVASVDASQAAKEDARTRRGFSPGLDALGWIFGLRMKPLGVSVVLKAATLPSSVSLPLLPSVHPPFCLYG